MWRSCLVCSEQVPHGGDADAANTAEKTGVSLEAFMGLLHAAPGSCTVTARQLLESVVLPQTANNHTAYVDTLPLSSRGPPLYYVASSWDVPLQLALQAVLQHLGLPTQWSTQVPTRTGLADDDRDSASSPSDLRVLSETFIFVDFMCINLWGTAKKVPLRRNLSRTTVTNEQSPGRRTSRSAPRRGSATTGQLDGPYMQQHSQGINGSQHRVYHREISLPHLARPETQMSKLDPQAFAMLVAKTLESCQSLRALLLCLDPELSVLGQLVPMHAAWRAMHAGLPIHMGSGKAMCRPKHWHRPAIGYRLYMAEESHQELWQALRSDIARCVRDQERPPRLPACGNDRALLPASHETAQELHTAIEAERQALWRALVGSAAAQRVKFSVRRTVVAAVFLALDGQYRAAKDKLSEVHAALVQSCGPQSMKTVQVQCMLVEVLLQLGDIQQAEVYSRQALEGCEAAAAAASKESRTICMHTLDARTCQARILELLHKPSPAEQIWRSTYLQLDQKLGPRHPLTVEFMAHLGRNVSIIQSRHEEGCTLLRECLKAAQVAARMISQGDAVLLSSNSSPDTVRSLSPAELLMLASQLAGDLATVLRLAPEALGVGPPQPEACGLDGMSCTTRILAAFQAQGSLFDQILAREEADVEVQELWDRAVSMCEAACGQQHEASCMIRARRAAANLPGSAEDKVGLAAVGDANVAAIREEVACLEHMLGLGHACTLEARSLLAGALELHGAWEQAEAEWRTVALLRKQALGEASVHYAAALTQYSGCLAQQQRLSDAASTAMAASAVTMEATGKLSLPTGAALLRQAEAQEADGDLGGAEASLRLAAHVYTHCHGATNWRTKQVYSALARLYMAQGREGDALALKATHKLRDFGST